MANDVHDDLHHLDDRNQLHDLTVAAFTDRDAPLSDQFNDDDFEPDDVYRCARCEAEDGRGRAPTGELVLAEGMSDELRAALERCRRCFARDGKTIDRAHVEQVHALFGCAADPLSPALAERAMEIRPELRGATLLVSDPEAVLVHPREAQSARLESLQRVNAPVVVIARARAALARAEAEAVRLEWERVFAWPAPAQFPGTVGFGEVARVMAETAIPPLVGAGDSGQMIAAITEVIPQLVIDSDLLNYRHELAALAVMERTAGDERRSCGLELAVRFLDELGQSGLRVNQDSLVDDCYFSLRSAGLIRDASRIYRVWLDVAVPRAWARVREL